MNDAELAAAIREHAYLEGDFVLRSGRRSRYYLDKYRFETRPELLGAARRARSRRAVAEHEPDAVRLAGPELGAVALAAAASLASGLPFLIVRKEAKDYGTGNRLEGAFERGRARRASSRTSSRPAAPPLEAVEALREAGLDVPHGGLRRRPRGGRCGRARAARSAAAAAVSRQELSAGGEKPRKTAWLSGIRYAW